MFHYQGSRTDKHVREHEVYAIGYPGEFTLVKKHSDAEGKFKKLSAELMQGVNSWSAFARSAFLNAANKQRILFVGVPLLVLVLVAGILAVSKRSPVEPLKQVVVRYYPDAEPAASSVAALTVKKSETAHATKDAAKADAGKKKDKPSIARVRTLEETTGAAAVMSLVVLPWGEVYLDGRLQGVSPPLIELQVAPGKHDIEIRNASFPVYKQTIQVKVGEKLTIKHIFAN